MPLANLTAAIATLNRPAALARCLDALLSGDAVPAEVIVVDQSLDHATQSIVEERKPSGVRLLYIRQKQRGLSASRNAAIARASCRVIAVTDDDCVPDRGWVAAIDRAFASQTSPAAVTGRVLPLGPDVPELYAISSRNSLTRVEFVGKFFPWLVGTGANFAVKREWLGRVGIYDERLGAGSAGKAAEDMDLLYRLLRAGAHVLYEPDALVYHERQSKALCLATSWSYGYGIGAFCGIWLRRVDLYALRVLGHWLYWHCKILAINAAQRQWLEVYQKWLTLKGTLGGLLYGLCNNRRSGQIGHGSC